MSTSEFDLGFRPRTYWDDPSFRQAVLRRVKGTRRREFVRRLLDGELGTPVDAELLSESLGPVQLKEWGRVHPALMGGESLPDSGPGEVEVVRVELASTTSDVISVRAHLLVSGRIGWRIVDEYFDEYGVWKTPFDTSEAPLSFGEMIDFMEASGHPGEPYFGVVLGLLRYLIGEDGEPVGHRGFFSVTSPFYSQLGAWYAKAIEDVIEASLPENDGDD